MHRRSFLRIAGAAPAAFAAPPRRHVPIGLELYSVRNELKADLPGTVRAVAQMGYEGVEFFAPYFQWTPDYARQVRTLLDELKIRCFSTHNGPPSFTAEGLPKAIELNQILGSRYIVMASAGRVDGLDGWKKVTETLAAAAERLRPLGLHAGFHNHGAEWPPVDGQRPMDVIAAGTPKDFALQLDTGPCFQLGVDAVAFIRANAGRIKSLHIKEWSSDPAKGYRVAVGEGNGNWKEIIDAAESVGGVEYYLIEQESSQSPMETVRLCLENFRKLRAS